MGMSAGDFEDVALFRERVEKLAAAQKKYQGIPIARIGRDPGTGEFVFGANTPDIEEVENLALKFRFFYAEKEPTRFQKILTKVRRRAQDEWACGYLDWLAARYKDAMAEPQTSGQLGLPVPNQKIIDLWFNSEFFHSDSSKRVELTDIHAAIGEAPSLFQLYVAIAHCSSYIRLLYPVVHRLSTEHPFIYTPNHHFRDAAAADGSDV
jgi:hypothetical protein